MTHLIPTLALNRKDFKIDWFSGKGSGGQHRNKHQNCCRITHLETGMKAIGQSHKERPPNQKEAFEKLSRRLISYYCVLDSVHVSEPSSERVRTYNAVDNVVRDHASGLEQTYRDVVEKGNIDEMVVERKKHV